MTFQCSGKMYHYLIDSYIKGCGREWTPRVSEKSGNLSNTSSILRRSCQIWMRTASCQIFEALWVCRLVHALLNAAWMILVSNVNSNRLAVTAVLRLTRLGNAYKLMPIRSEWFWSSCCNLIHPLHKQRSSYPSALLNGSPSLWPSGPFWPAGPFQRL